MKNERPDLLETGIFNPPARPTSRRVQAPARLYGGDPVPAPKMTTLGFSIKGEYTEDETGMCAKRQEADGKIYYFVKFSTSGFDIGRPLDPWGMYFKKEDLNKDSARIGRPRYDYRQVSESAFRDYLHYLTTHDTTYLKSTERQVLDA